MPGYRLIRKENLRDYKEYPLTKEEGIIKGVGLLLVIVGTILMLWQ